MNFKAFITLNTITKIRHIYYKMPNDAKVKTPPMPP